MKAKNIIAVTDNGANLILTDDTGGINTVQKNEMRSELANGSEIIYLVRTNNDTFNLNFDDVQSPVAANIDELFSTINSYLSTGLLA
jgi:hypothetical protein